MPDLYLSDLDAVGDQPHLSVDGVTAEGPNLSHWPGNRTPAAWERDLSTEICMAFASAEADARAAFTGGISAVLNNHYDTDGFLSLLAVLRPDVALPRRELALAAARTGDFDVYVDRAGFAIDRICAHIADPEMSPVADRFAGATGATRDGARYRWLIDNAESVLDDYERFDSCFAAEHAAVESELRAGGFELAPDPEAELLVVRSAAPIRRMVLNTVAASEFRVLHVIEDPNGTRICYHDRVESWFELTSVEPVPRIDLRQVAAELQARECDDAATWCADAPNVPVPELYFGLPGPHTFGRVPRELRPTRLDPAEVHALVRRALLASR